MIIRAEKTKNYTTIANFAFEDERLSLKAMGLFAYLMSKPDNWNITSRGIASQVKEGRDAVLSAMKELEDAGYLVRGKQKKVDGKFVTAEAVLYEKPVTVTGFPTTEEPTTENPTVLVNTNKVNTNKVTISNDIGASSLMKPQKTEYGNPEVNKLIETFVSLTGLRLMKMTEQRRFASLLIKANGLDDCVGACAVVAASMEDQYAPRISDLKELYYKFGQLQVYARKKQGEQKKGQVQDLSEL